MAENNATGPWWSKSVYTVGPLAFIAIALVLVILGVLPSSMTDTSKELVGLGGTLQHHMVDLKQQTEVLNTAILQASTVSKEAHVKQTEDMVRYLSELKIMHETQTRLLRQICRNVAKTEEARVRCDE